MVHRLLALALLACASLLSGSGAYAAGGDLLWQKQFDFGADNAAFAVAAADGRVVAVGWAQASAGDVNFIVRAHDSKTGRGLWNDQRLARSSQAFAVAIEGSRVFVLGIGADVTRSQPGHPPRVRRGNGDAAWEDNSSVSPPGWPCKTAVR